MCKKGLLLMLLVAMVAFSGCSLIQKDPVVDAAQVVVSVNDTEFTKVQVNNVIDNYLSNIQQQYANYGIPFDPADKDTRDEYTDAAIGQLVTAAVEEEKTKEMGFDVFTDEEVAKFEADAKTEYDGLFEMVRSMYFGAKEDDDEETKAKIDAEATAFMQQGGMSLEMMVESAKHGASAERLKTEVLKDVTVSDEEVKTAFDNKVANETMSYKQDPNAFGNTVNNGTTTYYAPAGYRYVKQILIGLDEESTKEINELQEKVTSANALLTSAQDQLKQIQDLLADETVKDEDKEDLKAQLTESEANVASATADAEKAQADVDARRATALETAKVEADEVYGKLQAGEDFYALMETNNDDPGMKRAPGSTNGYAVCEGFTPFDTSFVTAAMGLKAVGDYSEPTAGMHGYYIVRYESDIQEGAVALETVKDEISANELSAKQDTKYRELLTEWEKGMTVKIHKDRLEN